MSNIFRESITHYFEGANVSRSAGARLPVTRVVASRDEHLDLIVELTSDGAPRGRFEGLPAGSIYSPQECIEFRGLAGGFGVARGVVRRASQTGGRPSARGQETVETFSVSSLEWDLGREADAVHTVEWVLNVPDYLWPDLDEVEIGKPFRRSLGSGEDKLVMAHAGETRGLSRSLFLKIAGVDLYLARPVSKEDMANGAAQIIYRTVADQVLRDKVRECLSFILGAPIVYLGHTDYDAEWDPTSMRSVDAYSGDGAFFRHIGVTPYPMCLRYHRFLDREPVERAVNAILDHYEALNFKKLSWAYWHAVSAPVHSRAVHFGGLIEQLQRASSTPADPQNGRLLDSDVWSKIEAVLVTQLQTTPLDPEIRKVLKGKISSLNRAPANLVLKRLLDAYGLQISDAEFNAWKHRNQAAHGGSSGDVIETILGSKLLQILFHRMLASMTGCSDRYLDFYNLGHPIRPLFQAVPGR